MSGSRKPKFGIHNPSPIKKRNVKKTTSFVVPSLLEARRAELFNKLQHLYQVDPNNLESYDANSEHVEDVLGSPMDIDEPTDDPSNDHDGSGALSNEYVPAKHGDESGSQTARLLLYQRWRDLLPSLIDPLLEYISTSLGKVAIAPQELRSACQSPETCTVKEVPIFCLFVDHVSTYNVVTCECQSIAQVLVRSGLFPTAPLQPRMAISIVLLEFYHALFERSCDAVNALSSALVTFYRRRGYRVLSTKGETIQEPFRRGLGYAIQWYDCLRLEIDKQLEGVLASCGEVCKSASASIGTHDPDNRAAGQTSYLMSFPSTPSRRHTRVQELRTPQSTQPAPDDRGAKNITAPSELKSGLCDRYLRQLCPACFAGNMHGRPFTISGGDIHVAMDGNFHHRHLASSGDTGHFYDAKHFIPKAEVDLVGERMDRARKTKPKTRASKVPDEAIDACKESYHAAKGDQQNAATRRCDVNGLMALVCRHDIPIFFADIDTPGEQQKYAVALIERLFSLLPSNATVVVLYDIGCVLDRSLHTHDILPVDIVARVQLATAAMHAYGHQWACQLVYNPRLQEGMGLTDGEGTERLWSRMRRLIAVERNSARSRRVWLIDRQAMSIAEEYRDQLGGWITRRLRKGVEEHGRHAAESLRDCNVPTKELGDEWAAQREAQLSLRAHAPTRLKKELSNVFALQSELEAVDIALGKARAGIKDSGTLGQNTQAALERLTSMHETLKDEVDTLYKTLNIPHAIPDLGDVDITFIHTLFLARDLKINIRKRVIGSFLEWDRLDQAVGGRGQPLGTKLHQQTRSAIAKRKPALMAAIRKYNNYCKVLQDLRPKDSNVPIPQLLPTDLTQLRNNLNKSELMEDVWISAKPEGKARWLEESKVREGIRAMLKQERCLEERRRLGIEADNLCRWFGEELCAVELALRRPEYKHFQVLLKEKRDHLLLLKTRWTNPMAHALRFDEHIKTAERLAEEITGIEMPANLVWLTTLTVDNVAEEVEDLAYTSAPGGHEDQDLTIVDLLEEELIGEEPVDDQQVDLAHGSMGIDVMDARSGQDLSNTEDNDSDIEFVGGITKAVSQVNVDEIQVHWIGQTSFIRWDHTLLKTFERLGGSTAITTSEDFSPRIINRSDGRVGVRFGLEDIERIAMPCRWLSDDCINGCAVLFQAIFSNQKDHAIFSTFNIVHIRDNVSDERLWRNTQFTRFWKRSTWILPIHRKSQSHWVLAIVQVVDRHIALFDSFGQGPTTWMVDIKAISILIARLVRVAKMNGECAKINLNDQWSVGSLSSETLQTNQYDCGVWVLMTIAATLRGCDLSSIKENDIPQDMPRPPPSKTSSVGSSVFYDEFLVPGMNNGEALDALSASEAATTIKELNERESTPTPAPRKSQKRDSTPILQVPSRLRAIVTPTKKATDSPEVAKLLNARKQRVEQEIAAAGMDSPDTCAPGTMGESVPLPATKNLGLSTHTEQTRGKSAVPMNSGADLNTNIVSTRGKSAVPVNSGADLNTNIVSTRGKSAVPMNSGADLNTNIVSTRGKSAVPMNSGADLNTNIASNSTWSAVTMDSAINNGLAIGAPWSLNPAINSGPIAHMGSAEYIFPLTKRIMDIQQHIQTVQQQMQMCIREPGPEAATQLFHLQQQSAAAQGSLQQLCMQYSQLMTVGTTMANNASLPEFSPHPASFTVPPQPTSRPQHVEENQAPLFANESISSHKSRQPSYSETLKQMGFEEVAIPAPPSTKKSTTTLGAVALETKKVPEASALFDEDVQVTEHVSGISFSVNDAFSKMGNKRSAKRSKRPVQGNKNKNENELSAANDPFSRIRNNPQKATYSGSSVNVTATLSEKAPSATVLQQANTEAPMSFMLQAKRSTTPIPANDAPSVAFAAAVEHPKTRTELLRLNDTEDVSWCPEVPINIDEDMSELSYMDEPAPGDMPEYPQRFKTPTMAMKVIPETPNMLLGTAGSPQHTETATERLAAIEGQANLPPPPQVVLEPGMAQLFPGLPSFKPTEMSLEDLNLNPEDILPYPDELRQMLQEHEPLIDNKGGRPSSQTLKTVDDELTELDKRLTQLSKITGISVGSIMKRWNTTKSRGGSLWNIYQRYFTAHKEDELTRLGLDPCITVTGKIRADAYVAFRDVYPTTWPELLEYWAECTEVENSVKTVQQRGLQFRHIWRTLRNLGDTAQRRHGFVLVAAMVGNEVHHDHSLASVYEAKDVKGFFENCLHANEDKLLGLLKTTSYAVRDEIVAKDAEMIAAIEDIKTNITVKVEAARPADLLNQLVPSVNRSNSLIYEVKEDIVKAAAKVDLLLNAGNFPWVNILQICADHGVFIDNYPEPVSVPSAKENGQHNKGVRNITKQERALIIEALNATTNRMSFVKARDPADIKKNVHPVLICAPPTADSIHPRSKRVFANGTTDQQGYPRKAGRVSTIAPPSRSKATAAKSANPIMRKPKTRANIDSAEEDDDAAEALKKDGPARRTRSRARVTKPSVDRIVESEDEDDSEMAKDESTSEVAEALKKDGLSRRTRSRTRVTKPSAECVAESEEEEMGKDDLESTSELTVRPLQVTLKGTAKMRSNVDKVAPHEHLKHVPQDNENSPRPVKKMKGDGEVCLAQRVEAQVLNEPHEDVPRVPSEATAMGSAVSVIPSMPSIPPPSAIPSVHGIPAVSPVPGVPMAPTFFGIPGIPEAPALYSMQGSTAHQSSTMAPNIFGNGMPMISTWTPQMVAAYATLLQNSPMMTGGAGASVGSMVNSGHTGLAGFPAAAQHGGHGGPAGFLASAQSGGLAGFPAAAQNGGHGGLAGFPASAQSGGLAGFPAPVQNGGHGGLAGFPASAQSGGHGGLAGFPATVQNGGLGPFGGLAGSPATAQNPFLQPTYFSPALQQSMQRQEPPKDTRDNQM